MEKSRGSEQHGPRTAPFYSIPPRHLVSVEHPAIIKNVDNAIATLQGDAGISKILNPPKADTPANLHLRPEDAMSRPLQSTSTPSNNILLKVTVPKRTGRKRKRGTDEPFTGPPVTTIPQEPQRPSARHLLRSLRDNVGSYQVEPVGTVDRTHVFRGMPDFVFSTTANQFANRFRDQILSFDYDKMKQFDLDMSKGAISNVEVFPPPSFSHGDLPFGYIYRQNPTVRQSVDTSGNITTINTQQAAKVRTHLVAYDVAEVPTKPRESCPPISSLEENLQETIRAVEELFTQRPAWTRRGLRNSLKTGDQRYLLRHAIPYVGYIFRSGPWRDAIVKFGHDPRTSPDYRIYQTLMFRILPREPEVARDGAGGRRHTLPRLNEASYSASGTDPVSTDTHLFTGQLPLVVDGRMWMFCDIMDPLLRNILFPPDPPPAGFLRETCEPVCDGWFGGGTLAKVKIIMRTKILSLLGGRVPDDADFARVVNFPDHATPDDLMSGFMLDGKEVSAREMQMATEIRASLKGTASWRGKMTDGKAGESLRRGQEPDDDGEYDQSTQRDTAGSTGRRVQWQDEASDEESQGEEEAIEQEEMLEAQVAEAAESVSAALGEEYEDQGSEGEDSDDSQTRD
ncbi:hypothetical protein EYZ11_001093 [Aspergillus tanneri]|uniref:Tau 95 subunit of transcription factor TFIIIC n=1 Tax=Aspergillus tanneri TaxID=1220188 RepID=A0A4S3JVL0_9EURO|nr:tau 95 subunit of transcription factor TFIIIC [Aspergillus tanneri]KAA8642948.1 tau 95 subunit of transcription factor TFIIIC [Aspergillus tanneri]THC99455.1 hypothetical protein EYZ11_001093 [Aspergillus tanneri]